MIPNLDWVLQQKPYIAEKHNSKIVHHNKDYNEILTERTLNHTKGLKEGIAKGFE